MYEYKAKVIRVVDGDTIDVDIDLGFGIIYSNQRIRLAGIDAPESRTRDLEEKKFGILATGVLRKILPQKITLRTTEFNKGKFGRILGRIIIKDEFGMSIDINDFMLGEHLAVEYNEQSKEEMHRQHLLNREIIMTEGKYI